MNCSTVRAALPGLLYGHHEAEFTTQLEAHLASCAKCRCEREALHVVRDRLDRLPVPAVHVDLPDLYRQAGELGERRARRWRMMAILTGISAAAVLLLGVGTHLHVQVEKHQLTVRWGTAVADSVAPDPMQQVTGQPLNEE